MAIVNFAESGLVKGYGSASLQHNFPSLHVWSHCVLRSVQIDKLSPAITVSTAFISQYVDNSGTHDNLEYFGVIGNGCKSVTFSLYNYNGYAKAICTSYILG